MLSYLAHKLEHIAHKLSRFGYVFILRLARQFEVSGDRLQAVRRFVEELIKFRHFASDLSGFREGNCSVCSSGANNDGVTIVNSRPSAYLRLGLVDPDLGRNSGVRFAVFLRQRRGRSFERASEVLVDSSRALAEKDADEAMVAIEDLLDLSSLKRVKSAFEADIQRGLIAVAVDDRYILGSHFPLILETVSPAFEAPHYRRRLAA